MPGVTLFFWAWKRDSRSCSRYLFDALVPSIVRYPGSLYLVVFDNLHWISEGCRFYIDFKNVIAALSRLYSYGRSLYAIQNGCRISHAWIFKVAVCGSWRENTGFQYRKSKEQLLRNTRLLKKEEVSEFQRRNSCSKLC